MRNATLSGTDVTPTLPTPPSDAPADPLGTADVAVARKRRRRAVLVVVVFALAGLIVGSMFVPVPYYRIAPGSVRATEPLIEVQGVPTYFDEDAGAIGFTTIAFGPVSAFDAARGWLDGDVEILPESVALGGQDREQNDELNQVLMETSKDLAAAVALETLGYEVSIEGTGAMVVEVIEDAPVEGQLEAGDTIVEVEGRQILTSDDLLDALGDHAPGDRVTMVVEDIDGDRRTQTVTPAERPEDPSQAFLGVSMVTRDFDFILPFEVSIDAGLVGGPSAGLAFTLGIIDVLTPGDLTGGVNVAVTGTIRPDGGVGIVGGVRQKAVAARASGAEVFIVPSAEIDAARAGAGDMRVVAVDTIDEALAVLAELGGEFNEELAERAGVGADTLTADR
ncbi:MAG: PDZ domain-containing protein [Acidimicrobiia bacterium]|nr:PDZ domain-containing protein [Acidimicrobiia bacterium]